MAARSRNVKPPAFDPAPIDEAVREFNTIPVHPMAIDQIRQLVERMLRGLGHSRAADRWIGLPDEAPATRR